jgi:hypothetical protein
MKEQMLAMTYYKSSFKVLDKIFGSEKQSSSPQQNIREFLSSKSELEIAMMIRKARDLASEKDTEELEDPILNFLLQYFLDNVGTIEEMARSLKKELGS